MVFKRKASRRSGRRAKASRRGSSSSGLKPTDMMLAGAVYGFARPIVANMLPSFFNLGPVDSDNAIIGGLGFWQMPKQKGFMKALAATALASETGIVVSKLSTGQAPAANNTAALINSYN